MGVSTFATNGKISESSVFQADFGDVTFDCEYPEVGSKIHVSVNGYEDDDFVCNWLIDGVEVCLGVADYTPVSADMYSTITAEVYYKKELIGSKSIYLSDLPVVYIETKKREEIFEKEKELKATLKIQGNDEFNDSSVLYDGEMKIKGRGNTTWQDNKKPYKIKLDSKANLFGMGKNKHWVLLSNPYDSTYSRNAIAYQLAEEMGISSMSFEPVDVVLNGEPVGSYLICEHVRVGENRVDITDWDTIAEDAAKAIYKDNASTLTKGERDELVDKMTEDMSWTTSDEVKYKGITYKISDYYDVPSVDGGYLLCVETSGNFETKHGTKVEITKPEGVSADMTKSISDYYNAFEEALFSDDFCTEYGGKKMRYTDFIDVESFAKGLLLNEILQNKDFGMKSTYFSKDVGGKLVFGPVWDFDLSSDTEATVHYFDSWYTTRVGWVARLCSDPYMLGEIRKAYWNYRFNAIADIISDDGFTEEYFNKIDSSARNDRKIWAYGTSYDDSVNTLRQWLENRIDWMDGELATDRSFYDSMSARFTNKEIINSTSFTLEDGLLSVDFGENLPAVFDIYSDGVLIDSYSPDASVQSFIVPNYDLSTLTFVGYDADGKVISSSWTANESPIDFLYINQNPNKLSYSPDEKIDLSGIEVVAFTEDGDAIDVVPDGACSFKKDAAGKIKYCTGKITSVPGGRAFIRIFYNGVTEDIPVNVSPSENYEMVEKLISKFPSSGFDNSYIPYVIEAESMYDDLSDEAKLKVSNREKLESALAYINRKNTEQYCVLGCYIDSGYYYNMQNYMVYIVKGNPTSVIRKSPDGSTSTFSEKSSHFVSKVKVGSYYLWTIYANVYDSDICAYTRPVESSTISFTISDYIQKQSRISDLKYDAWVFDDKSATVSFSKIKDIKDVRITENGNEINSMSTGSGKVVMKIDSLTPGEHTYTLEYKDGGEYIPYQSFSIYSRTFVDERKFEPEEPPIEPPVEPPAEEIPQVSIDRKSISMSYKGTDKLAASQEKVVWSSSNNSVVTVSNDGTIYASGKGTARITCEYTSESGKTATDYCDVTVSYTTVQWIIIIALFGWIWYI